MGVLAPRGRREPLIRHRLAPPLSAVTQYDDPSATNVRDQVAFEYDGWVTIEKFHQDVDSAMSPPGTSSAGRGAFAVQYAVSKATPSGGARALRRDTVYDKAAGSTFAQAGFDYGSGDIADLMSRVQGLTTGSSPVTVATYDYLGAGHLVGTTLDQAGLNTSVFTEAVGVHTYCDVDDFNRPTRWNWVRIGAGGGAAGGFYNTQIAYDENSNPIYTLDDAHVRNSNGKHLFDVVYGLDDLNRVTSADEGNATGSPPSLSIQTSYHTRTELWNSLTLTGNWGNRRLDIDGDGAFSGPDDRDEQSGSNVFTAANEWTARSSAKTGGDHDDYATTYDAVGNLTQEDLDSVRGLVTGKSGRGFVYDVFGRLVAATDGYTGGALDICKYRYNGLGMRTMWQHDASGGGTLSNSERYYFMHDEKWRIVATFRDQDAAPKESFVWHAAGQGGFGGSSYIDSVILRDRDNYTGGTPNPMTSASDGTLEERRFYCQNWRADVVALTASDGTPLEYVRYSAYGEATVYPVADVNMDGVVNSSDLTDWTSLLSGGSTNVVYADSDLDFDGADDQASGNQDSALFYASYAENLGLSGKGLVSSAGIDNRIGYAGYQWDPAARAYHVRYRVYLPDIGRWTRRDPIGYVDGMSLYELVRSAPVDGVDPLGLAEGDCTGATYRDQCEDCCRSNLGPSGMGTLRVFDDCMATCKKKPKDPGMSHPWINWRTYGNYLGGGWDGLVCWCQGAAEYGVGGSAGSMLIWGLDPPTIPCDALLIDPNNPDLDWSRLSGQVSCFCIEAAAGGQLGSGNSISVGKRLRIEGGYFKWRGKNRFRFHFHYGTTKELRDGWHLPYEWWEWYNNWKSIRRRL